MLKIKLLKHTLLFALFTLFLSAAYGQNDDGLELLDESLFIGGLSPTVLTSGNVEVNFYSSLFSSWIALHESVIESPVQDRLRLTEFNSNLETYFGLSRRGRWDIGARVRYGKRRLANAATDPIWDVFSSSDEESANRGTDKTYSGLREVGVRFRLMPFEGLEAFTINAGYSYGEFGNSSDDEAFKLADRNSFDVNLSYFVSLNDQQTSYYYFIVNGTSFQPGSLSINEDWLHNTSGSFFIVQRLGKFVIYPGMTYTLAFKPPSSGSFSDKSLIKSNEQLLGTLGIQYQPSFNTSFNISASMPFILSTTNLRQRLVRDSYSFVTIGGRILL
tara:strand:+ start:216 stop:1208 length:993 start_codon:yes stop_codon:yes gene_type:complete